MFDLKHKLLHLALLSNPIPGAQFSRTEYTEMSVTQRVRQTHTLLPTDHVSFHTL